MSLASANEIIPGLWLGNEESSQSEDFLKKTNIKAIVNATKHIPDTYQIDIDYYRVPVNDPGPSFYMDLDQEDNALMLKHLPYVLPFIKRHLDRDESVLVHCHAGIQRSATIVLAYLITYIYTQGNKTDRLKYALRHILRERPIVFYAGTSMNFKPAISQYIIDL
jgi:protein-tyrosine phosphatase